MIWRPASRTPAHFSWSEHDETRVHRLSAPRTHGAGHRGAGRTCVPNFAILTAANHALQTLGRTAEARLALSQRGGASFTVQADQLVPAGPPAWALMVITLARGRLAPPTGDTGVRFTGSKGRLPFAVSAAPPRFGHQTQGSRGERDSVAEIEQGDGVCTVFVAGEVHMAGGGRSSSRNWLPPARTRPR